MNIYSARAEERRKQFNKIINGCDMVLFNNAPNLDDDLIWEGEWLGENPFTPTPCEWFLNDSKPVKRWCCATHQFEGDESETENDFDGNAPDYECAFSEGETEGTEVYQWFACNQNDAEFLARHHQYVVYSEKLDLHLLAITHFGTSWDYTHMVDDFEDCYHGLDELDDEKEVV